MNAKTLFNRQKNPMMQRMNSAAVVFAALAIPCAAQDWVISGRVLVNPKLSDLQGYFPAIDPVNAPLEGIRIKVFGDSWPCNCLIRYGPAIKWR